MTLLEFLLVYRYLAIFLGAVIEGPVVMAAAGFLVRLGYFDPALAFGILLIGDLVSDAGWYALGYFRLHGFAIRFGNLIGFRQGISDTVARLYRKHQDRVIVISKLSMGFGFNLIVLVTAGALRIPFRRFIALNALGGVFWVGAFMTLGYFFGNVYLTIGQGLQVGFLLGAAILFILLFYGIGRLIREQFIQRTKHL